jgi:formiminotetrahydrofolate cyclodeaminase
MATIQTNIQEQMVMGMSMTPMVMKIATKEEKPIDATKSVKITTEIVDDSQDNIEPYAVYDEFMKTRVEEYKNGMPKMTEEECYASAHAEYEMLKIYKIVQ